MAAEKRMYIEPLFSFNSVQRGMELNGARFVGLKALEASMAQNSNTDFYDQIWPVGASFVVPSDLEKGLFEIIDKSTHKPLYGVIVNCTNGWCRSLYFCSLKKTVTPYKDANGGFEVDYSKKVLESDTLFHDEVKACRNDLEIYKLLKSKRGGTISVKEVKECETVRIRYVRDDTGGFIKEPIGLRKGRVACFDYSPLVIEKKGNEVVLIGCAENVSGDITIPKGVTRIGHGVFSGLKAPATIWIPGIWHEAPPRVIHIPDTVKYIDNYAFRKCHSLREIYIPDSVTHIGDGAFESCLSLCKIHIPDSVTHIGDGAFGFCCSLCEIHMSNSLTHIGEKAFWYCDSLSKIFIPKRTREKFEKLLPGFASKFVEE